jgi:hypothetical protein
MISNAVLIHSKDKRNGIAEYMIVNNDNICPAVEVNINDELIAFCEYDFTNYIESINPIVEMINDLVDKANTISNDFDDVAPQSIWSKVIDAQADLIENEINDVLREMQKTNQLLAHLLYSDLRFNAPDNKKYPDIRARDDFYALHEIINVQALFTQIFNTIGDDKYSLAERYSLFTKEYNHNFDVFFKSIFTPNAFTNKMFDVDEQTTNKMHQVFIATSPAEYYLILLYLHFQSDKRINVCKFCGGLLTPKTAKATFYCDRVVRNNRKCKEIAPHYFSKEQIQSDEVLLLVERKRRALYQRFYKNYDEYLFDEQIEQDKIYQQFMFEKQKILTDYHSGKISKDDVIKFVERYK